MGIPQEADECLGRYQLEAEIANGQYATVWKAHDPKIGRSVALKVLDRQLLDHEPSLSRFLHERAVVARITHPNVVPVLDAGDADGVPYFTMPLVEPGALSMRLRRSSLSPRLSRRVLAGIAQALDAIHEQGFVHADVKPSNVLVARTGHAYLADFGGVEARVPRGPSLPRVLTPAYASPEQQEKLPLTTRSDLYQLALVFYECLTGELPRLSATTNSRVTSGGSGNPRPRSWVKRETRSVGSGFEALDAVLARALAIDAGDRFPTASAFIKAIDQAIDLAPQGATVAPRPREDARSRDERDHPSTGAPIARTIGVYD
jgi:serine/threonine protein kinase